MSVTGHAQSNPISIQELKRIPSQYSELKAFLEILINGYEIEVWVTLHTIRPRVTLRSINLPIEQEGILLLWGFTRTQGFFLTQLAPLEELQARLILFGFQKTPSDFWVLSLND